MPDIVNFGTGFHHISTLNSPTKSKTGVDKRINFTGFKDFGMDHTGAAKLNPTFFTKFTALTQTKSAADIDFKTRLSKTKIVRTKTSLTVRRKKVFGEIINHSDKMGDTNAFIDHQTFKLEEGGVVIDIFLRATATGNIKHTDRELTFEHFSNLATGGVRSNNHAAKIGMRRSIDKEGLKFVTGRER